MQTAMLSKTAMPKGLGLSSKLRLGGGFQAVCMPVRRLALPSRAIQGPRAFKEGEDEKTEMKQADQKSAPSFRYPGQEQVAPVGVAEEVPYRAAEAARWAPAFTRRREHFVGRVAMLGVAAMWLGELYTGLGPMGQLSYELSVPIGWAFWATSFLAMGHLVLALNKGSATFAEANQSDIARRSRGWTGITAIEPDTTRRTQSLGQFLLRSELTLGRTAMLIFASAMLIEYALSGESPLAHFGYIAPGVPLAMSPRWFKFFLGLFVAGGLGVFSGFGSNKDPETY